MARTRTLAAAALAVGLAAGVAWFTGHGSGGLAGAGPAPEVACAFTVGEAHAWRLEMSAETSSRGIGGGGAQPVAGGAAVPPTRGAMRWQVLDGDGEAGWTVAVAFEGLTGHLEGGAGQVFAAVIDRTCAFERVGFAPELQPQSRRALRNLLASLEVELPGGAAPERWVRLQADGLGRYEAVYSLGDDDEAPGSVDKRVTRYLELFEPGLRVVQASASWVAAPALGGAWLERLSGTFSYLIHTDGPLPTAPGKSRAALEARVSGEVSLAAIPARGEPLALDLAGLVWMGRDDPPEALATIERPPEPETPTIVGLPLDAVLTRLSAIRVLEGPKAAGKIARLLAAWIEANDGLDQLAARLAAGTWPEDLIPSTFLGLEKVGTAEVHELLVDIAQDTSRPEVHRLQSIWSMAELPTATHETVQVLESLGTVTTEHAPTGIQNSALFSLGRAEARVRAANPEVAAAARAALLRRVDEAPGTIALSMALKALGNSGHPDYLTTLQENLATGTKTIRAGAIRGLQGQPLDLADPLLVAHYQSEELPGLRQRVIDTMHAQAEAAGEGTLPGWLVDRAIAWLAEEPERAPRLALIEILGAAADNGSAKAYAALVGHFSQEADQQLLATIGKHVQAEDLLP